MCNFPKSTYIGFLNINNSHRHFNIKYFYTNLSELELHILAPLRSKALRRLNSTLAPHFSFYTLFAFVVRVLVREFFGSTRLKTPHSHPPQICTNTIISFDSALFPIVNILYLAFCSIHRLDLVRFRAVLVSYDI